MNLSKMGAALGLGMVLTGCVAEMDAEVDVEETVDEASSALVNGNALNFNALNFNALNFNALNFNALTANSLEALLDPGADGALARQAMRYMVSCALTSSQTFTFVWTDALGILHAEIYAGQLGLAPTWATGPLNLTGQQLVSACLAARVNYYQVPVIISARSLHEPLKTMVNTQELADYPDVEGAFWGNLFAPEPYVSACYNPATVTNSRAHQRDCAVGHVTTTGVIEECGIIDIVGPCSLFCQGFNNAGQYYPSCQERPGVSATPNQQVITTALP